MITTHESAQDAFNNISRTRKNARLVARRWTRRRSSVVRLSLHCEVLYRELSSTEEGERRNQGRRYDEGSSMVRTSELSAEPLAERRADLRFADCHCPSYPSLKSSCTFEFSVSYCQVATVAQFSPSLGCRSLSYLSPKAPRTSFIGAHPRNTVSPDSNLTPATAQHFIAVSHHRRCSSSFPLGDEAKCRDIFPSIRQLGYFFDDETEDLEW